MKPHPMSPTLMVLDAMSLLSISAALASRLVGPGFERGFRHLVAPGFRSPAASAHKRFGLARIHQPHAAVLCRAVGDDELIMQGLAKAYSGLDLNLVAGQGSRSEEASCRERMDRSCV